MSWNFKSTSMRSLWFGRKFSKLLIFEVVLGFLSQTHSTLDSPCSFHLLCGSLVSFLAGLEFSKSAYFVLISISLQFSLNLCIMPLWKLGYPILSFDRIFCVFLSKIMYMFVSLVRLSSALIGNSDCFIHAFVSTSFEACINAECIINEGLGHLGLKIMSVRVCLSFEWYTEMKSAIPVSRSFYLDQTGMEWSYILFLRFQNERAKLKWNVPQ